MLPSLAGLALHTDMQTDLEKAKWKHANGLRLTNYEDGLLMEDEVLRMYERGDAPRFDENDNMSDSDSESDMNEYYSDWRVAVRDGDVERVRERNISETRRATRVEENARFNQTNECRNKGVKQTPSRSIHAHRSLRSRPHPHRSIHRISCERKVAGRQRRE